MKRPPPYTPRPVGRRSIEHMLRSAYQRFAESGNDAAHGPARAAASVAAQPRSCPGGLGRIDPAGAHHLLRALSAARTPDGLANIVLRAVADTTGASRVLGLTGEGEQLTVRAVHEKRQDHHRRRAMDRGAV